MRLKPIAQSIYYPLAKANGKNGATIQVQA